jgi:hypothetical protein
MSGLAKQGNMPQILAMGEVLKQMPQADYELEHFQIPGVYVRYGHIKAGCMLTGKVHKHVHMSMLVSGTLKYATANGADVVTGPKLMIDQPGTKRIGYAVTDVVFMNIHATNSIDIQDIEQELVCDTFEEYEEFLRLEDKEESCLLTQ